MLAAVLNEPALLLRVVALSSSATAGEDGDITPPALALLPRLAASSRSATAGGNFALPVLVLPRLAASSSRATAGGRGLLILCWLVGNLGGGGRGLEPQAVGYSCCCCCC